MSNHNRETITKDKQIRMAINRAKEQGLDISESDLIECWNSSSQEDTGSEGETVSEGEIECKKRNIVCKGKWYKKRNGMKGDKKVMRNKKQVGGKENATKTKPAARGGKTKANNLWGKLCSSNGKPKKRKTRKAKYVVDVKEKRKQKEEREYIRRLNDLTRPMPKSFWERTEQR